MTDGPGLATDFADADASPGLQLWRVTNAWQSVMRQALAPFGLTHVQFVLLASLAWQGAPMTQRALADHAGTDPMMTSQVVRALEGKALVIRGPHPTDARAKAVAPTPAGLDLVNRAIVVVEDADRRYFEPLGDGVGAFAASLGSLAAAKAR